MVASVMPAMMSMYVIFAVSLLLELELEALFADPMPFSLDVDVAFIVTVGLELVLELVSEVSEEEDVVVSASKVLATTCLKYTCADAERHCNTTRKTTPKSMLKSK